MRGDDRYAIAARRQSLNHRRMRSSVEGQSGWAGRCALYGIGIVTGSPQSDCVSATGRVVDQLQFVADRRCQRYRIGMQVGDQRVPHRQCGRAAGQFRRPIVVVADPDHGEVGRVEAGEPAVARVVRRTGLAGDAAVRVTRRPTGAALHHQRQRVVQLCDGVRLGDLLHFQRISIQRGPGFVFDREHRLVRSRKSAAREYAVDLEHRQRRHVDGAEQQRRECRRLRRCRRARQRARRPDRRQQLDRVARLPDSTNRRARAPAVPDRGPRCRSCRGVQPVFAVSDGSSGASSTIDARLYSPLSSAVR